MRIGLQGIASALVMWANVAMAGNPTDGRWAGTMLQTDVTGQTSYEILMELDGDGGRTLYPELDCGAELLAVATVNGYTIYSETVTEGRIDPQTDTGCIDGFLIVQPEADTLLVEWVGNHAGVPYMAMSVLARADDDDKQGKTTPFKEQSVSPQRQ